MEVKLNPFGMVYVSGYEACTPLREMETETGADLIGIQGSPLIVERSAKPLSLSYDEARKIINGILNGAGYQECRVVRTKSTGRSRYVTGAEGYRHHRTTGDPDVVPLSDPLRSHKVQYLGVRGLYPKDLKKYLHALHNAGIEAYISGTDIHPTTKTVWVFPPILREI